MNDSKKINQWNSEAPALDLTNPEHKKAVEEAKAFMKEPPTEQQVVEWFKTDLHAAHYALTALLTMPLVVEDIAKRFYAESMQRMEMKVTEQKNKANGRN